MKKITLLFLGIAALTISAKAQTTIFSETFGTPSDPKTEVIDNHVWDNGSPITYSWTKNAAVAPGTLNIRTSGTSSNDPTYGYTGASGSGNLYFNKDASNSFTISNINTSSYSDIKLSFGIIGSKTAGDAKKMVVEYSTNGTDYSQIAITNISNLTALITNWEVVSAVTLPSANNLLLKFSTPNVGEIRIDDIKITGTATATSVKTINPDNRKVTASNSTLKLDGFTSGNVEIYNTQGKRVFTSVLKQTIETQLAKGLYIVRVGDFRQKISL